MTIKEAAKITGVSTDNLRYYERIGIIPPVKRTASGVREFEDVDIRWIRFVLKFKKAGMSLEAIIEYIRLMQLGEESKEARKVILEELREQLQERIQELTSCLDLTEYKIENYEDLCYPVTQEMVECWKAKKG